MVKKMPKSLQTFHKVEIGQGSDVAVHVGLPIRREFDAADGINPCGIAGHEFLPGLSLPRGQVNLKYFGRNPAKTVNIKEAPIRRPARRHLIGQCAGDRYRITTGDGVEVDPVVRSVTGDNVALRRDQHDRVHAFGADWPRLAFLHRLDEMMVGFFNLVYDPRISPKDLVPEKKVVARSKTSIVDH
jgi:hypothetical protein